MKPEISTPTYFPFTFIRPSLLEVMPLCFDRVTVYQAAHAGPDRVLQGWIDSGFLDVRSPCDAIIDKKALERTLREFKNWASMHQHTDLALLKQVGQTIAPVGPKTSKLVSEIKSKDLRSKKTGEETDFSVHLFLHLAQAFDRDAWELSEQLKLVDDRFRTLQTSFRQDQEEPMFSRPRSTETVFSDGDPGDFMLEKRMLAWNHLFQEDATGSNLLFTDSESAFEFLLDTVPEKVEVLNVDFRFQKAGPAPGNQIQLPWRNHLSEIFASVLTTPWNTSLRERLVQAGREIGSEMDAMPVAPTRKSGNMTCLLRWYVLPGVEAQGLLGRSRGQEKASEPRQNARADNTLVGLIRQQPSSQIPPEVP